MSREKKEQYSIFEKSLARTNLNLFTQARRALPVNLQRSVTSSFQINAFSSVMKVSLGGTLVACAAFVLSDMMKQKQARAAFYTSKPKGKVTFEKSIALSGDDMDSFEFDQENRLSTRYGNNALVKIGGARKEGFEGIVTKPSEEKRDSKLKSSSICHVALAVKKADGQDEKPLILGRQSPMGPIPTLYHAIEAGYNQFKNPVEGKTVQSAMIDAMSTKIQNEQPHLVKGTSFDTYVIEDLPIPVEFVDLALERADKDLNPTMTFLWDNCITTKTYLLLDLTQQVHEWSQSGEANAPTKQKSDAFITGCYDIIHKDIKIRGYGVLNNDVLINKLDEVGQVIQQGKDLQESVGSVFQQDAKF